MAATDVAYAAPGGVPLLARLYRPAGVGPHPAVVEVHGGSWAGLDRTAGRLYCQALAGAGFVVASVDFRQGPQHQHPAASADVTAAVRWLRLTASEHGVDPDRVGLVGSSSGGHLALLAATRPDSAEHRGVPIVVGDRVVADPVVPAGVGCVAALWPPVHPLARLRYARAESARGAGGNGFRPELLVAGTEAYFGTEAAMAEASVARLVRHGQATDLPPAWVAYPELDRNVPRPLVDDLVDAWHGAGGAIEVTTYPGEVHAFGHRPGASTDRFVSDLAAFLRRHLA